MQEARKAKRFMVPAIGLSLTIFSGLSNASNEESLINEEVLPSLVKKEKIVPSYQPRFWSIISEIRYYNNCYNYATNTVHGRNKCRQ